MRIQALWDIDLTTNVSNYDGAGQSVTRRAGAHVVLLGATALVALMSAVATTTSGRAAAPPVAGQLRGAVIEPSHPAIGYDGPTADRVSALDRRLQAGETRLTFDRRTGYLASLLDALEVPVESQVAVFSGTSLQSPLVNARNPRVIYFNDSTAVAWMPGGFIELASLDPRQGAVFHLLPQTDTPRPALVREPRCLSCHYSRVTLGVPGFLVRSIPSGPDGAILPWLGNYTTDHRSPLEERWGGWYVTGRGGGRHLGNAPVTDRSLQEVRIDERNLGLASMSERLDTSRYLSPYSDMAALLVFDHQMQMMNLLTRLGWEARVLAHDAGPNAAEALRPAVDEIVDYMLFVDEAPLTRVASPSGFMARFSAAGPRDSRGRSLRDFDLERRIFKYPCSYMIYSDAFDALPPAVRRAVYERLWQVLSGTDRAGKYSRLTAADRQAVIEILRETRPDLPAAFSLRPSLP